MLLFLILIYTPLIVGSLIRFQEGYEYIYDYDGKTNLPQVATYLVKGKIGIVPMNETLLGNQECLLYFHNFYLAVQTPHGEHLQDLRHNLTKSLIFEISPHGEIVSIEYPEDENSIAIFIKKNLLGALSSRLHVSEDTLKSNRKWSYKINETSHDGENEVTYHAEKSNEGITFKRTKTFAKVPNADSKREMVLHYHPTLGIPHSVNLQDSYKGPTKAQPHFKPYKSRPGDIKQERYAETPDFEIPSMSAEGQLSLKFKEKRFLKEHVIIKRSSHIKDTLTISEYPEIKTSFKTLEKEVNGNLSCVISIKSLINQTRLSCFKHLVHMLRQIPDEDLISIADRYFKDTLINPKDIKIRAIMVDVFGSIATKTAQFLLTERILLSSKPIYDLIMSTLVHFMDLQEIPPKVFLDALESFAFIKPYKFSDNLQTALVHDRLILILGRVIKEMEKFDPIWSTRMTLKLHSRLKVFDPWHHRQRREILSEDDFQKEIEEKALLLLALGNAASKSSFDYFKSYMNDTESPSLLRRNSLWALGSLHDPQAADLLLVAAISDHEDHVRYDAKDLYHSHPMAIKIHYTKNGFIPDLRNLTSIEAETHVRRSRGILTDIVRRIFQGFQFTIQIPGIDWQKKIGSDDIGALFGLTIKNELKVDIKPLEGSAKIEINNEAFAKALLGFIGTSVDLIVGRVCFKGGIVYNFNVLGEFNVEEIIETVKMFDEIIPNLIITIKKNIKRFNDVMNAFNTHGIKGITDSFIKALQKLPEILNALMIVAKEILKQIAKISDDAPPFFQELKSVIIRLTNLYNDIRRDVINFYNNVVDSIQVTLPLAADQMVDGIRLIVNGIRILFNDPKKAIGDIQIGVYKIGGSVALMLDVKQKIEESASMIIANPPYWMNLKVVTKGLKEDVIKLVNAIKEIAKWVETGIDSKDPLHHFTGTEIKEMKMLFYNEIKQALNKAKESMSPLDDLMEPFKTVFGAFVGFVIDVKENYDTIRKTYTQAKNLIQKIFGTKFHKLFPKTYLQEESCGESFYPSRGKGDVYAEPGVLINATGMIVAPFAGLVKKIAANKVSITVSDMKDTEIVLENINLLPDLDGEMIFKGENLGEVVLTQHCNAPHIHLVMRSSSDKDVFIDPTRYLNKRKIEIPKWVQDCNDYKLIILDTVISSGMLTGKEKLNDTSPSREPSPDVSDLPSLPKIDTKEINSAILSFGKEFSRTKFETTSKTDIQFGLNYHKQRDTTNSRKSNETILANFFGKIKSLLEKLNMTKSFFNMKHVTVVDAIKFFTIQRKPEIINKLKNILETLDKEEQLSRETCDDVIAFDLNPLKNKIVQNIPFLEGIWGKKHHSSKRDIKCSTILDALPKNNNKYCKISDTCSSVLCCMSAKFLNFLTISLRFGMAFNPCTHVLTFSIDKWRKDFKIPPKFAHEGEISTSKYLFNTTVDFRFKYSIAKHESQFKISAALVKCKGEICTSWIDFLKQAVVFMPECNENYTLEELFDKNVSIDISKYDNMTLKEIEKRIEVLSISPVKHYDLLRDIRSFQTELLRQYLTTSLTNFYDNDFKTFDLCLNALELTFKNNIIFFKATFTYFFGPISVKLYFEAGGSYGIGFKADLCLMSMKIKSTAVPKVAAYASASIGIGFIVYGELQLTGYILTIDFPLTAEITFNHFPLDVRARMDMILVPFRLELHGLCTVDLYFFRKVIFKALIWKYTTTSITTNIFNKGDIEMDKNPPKFHLYRPKLGSFRRNRSLFNRITSSCVVEQIKGRDYTDPAFLIEIEVEDDKSDVKMTLCVGTFSGGCNVISTEPLAGSSTILANKLLGGVRLYFTITATDAAGGSSQATCQLPSYDITLPDAKITPEFLTTSHPNIIRASVTILDDSKNIMKKISIGYGRSAFGEQLIRWTSLRTRYMSTKRDTDPIASFKDGKAGRVLNRPLRSVSSSKLEHCAKLCLEHKSPACLSFNYDNITLNCEILGQVESKNRLIRQEDHYYNHEYNLNNPYNSYSQQRSFYGNNFNIRYSDLNLTDNELIYINVYILNELGYQNIITSKPIKTDFTPPGTGPLGDIQSDVFSHDVCLNYMLPKWRSKCVEPTHLKNHRHVTDGKGAATIFHGQEQMIDLLYTRVNTYLSCNWNGIHDNDTGILGYAWSYGSSICKTDVLDWSDPHESLFDRSQWNYKALAHPLNLLDGKYFLSMRAYNNIDFGGPLTTTICHSTPLGIDNTPPILESVGEADYNEFTFAITLSYNYSDEQSDIRDVSIALGKSSRDTLVMEWEKGANASDTFLKHNFKIPDGISTWVKIRGANNVDLRTSGHAPEPILVDTTPPLPGYVFDGHMHGVDIDFQHIDNEICVNWGDFSDPESAIGKYLWGVGSIPGLDNVISFHKYSSTIRESCHTLSGPLTHNNTYYSTIIAFHNGHDKKNISVTSDGVLYDATIPVSGWINDGLDTTKSMKFSSELSTVSANWNNFFDPESGIKEYSVKVYKKESTTVELLQDSKFFANITNSVTWYTFHLKHGDHIFVELNTTNQALLSLITKSGGYTIDMTDPSLIYLGDGNESGMNRQFSASLTELSANWKFEDPESGIDHYQVSIFEMFGGSKQQIYPEGRNSFITLPANINIWTSDISLSLRTGALYNIRIAAFNGAGMSSVHTSDGVIIDPTSPIMEHVEIGTIAGEAEDVDEDGFVLINDEHAIKATWRALDPESGIVAYWVAVGTSPGGTEVSDYQNLGSVEHSSVEGLHLQLYNEEIKGPTYYLTVKAENGAGLFSKSMISSKIKIVEGDVAGIVSDGPYTEFVNDTTIGIDIDYQLDRTSATTHFHGFRSKLHGIVHYEWAIGTEPRLDDIQPYTSMGIVVDESQESPGQGISGSGRAQALLSLQHGETYYTTVRAITGVGNVIESVSDGFTVDVTAPKISFLSITNDVFAIQKSLEESTYYQKLVDSLSVSWITSDNESAITSSQFSVGSYPGSSDICNSTNTEGQNTISNMQIVPITEGQSNVINIQSENKAGIISSAASGGIVIDITPPISGNISCSKFIREFEEIFCSWNNFYDSESRIAGYNFSIGFNEDDESLLTAIQLSANITHFTARDLRKYHAHRYVAKITAINYVGLTATALSETITVDESPPESNMVIIMSSSILLNASSPKASDEITAINCQEQDCEVLRATCQKSLTDVRIVWEPFSDAESPIISYEVAVGITPGGTQLVGFHPVEHNHYYATISYLDLSEVSVIYATIKGHNAVKLSNKAASQPVFISHISSGLAPLGISYVKDGKIYEKDIDYQNQNNYISAHWNFSGDPCPILKYEWAIIKIDGTFIQAVEPVSALETSAENDELNLRDGESYFVIVQATNYLGYKHSLRSNGVTVVLEPLLPGTVRHGDIFGVNLNAQKSITTLSANWDGFGNDNSSYEQSIDYYEVAAGTDRRYPGSRINIHPFINVGLNTSWSFTNLALLPTLATYYITVRAHSTTSAMAEVTSSGIQVGIGGQGIKAGMLELSRFINSATDIIVSWSSFKSEMPILWHIWGVSSTALEDKNIDCSKMELFNPVELSRIKLFDILPLTKVGKDTIAESNTLKLEHSHTYDVLVVGIDEAAMCNLTTGKVTVDLTPPILGKIKVGPYYDLDVMFSKEKTSLAVEWEGFHDPESGINFYEIILYASLYCPTAYFPTPDTIPITEPILLSYSTNSYIFINVDLKEELSYFVHLTVFNRAGSSAEVVSPPILTDLVDPEFGDIKDGIVISNDETHQSFSDHLEGVFIYLPNNDGEACSLKNGIKNTFANDWHKIDYSGIWGLPMNDIYLRPQQVDISDKEGIAVTLQRDLKHNVVISGAIYTLVEVDQGSIFEVKIKATNDLPNIVTSVVFWDGPNNVFGDQEVFDGDNHHSTLKRQVRSTSKINLDFYSLPNPEVDESLKNIQQTGCGFQLHPNTTEDNEIFHMMFVWCNFHNFSSGSSRKVIILNFDPADSWHSYSVHFNKEKLTIQEDWSLSLFIDGKASVQLTGIPKFGENTKLVLSAWNRNNYIPEIKDIFTLPQATTYFKDIKLPGSKSCRYARPFRSSQMGIKTFYAGVGTSAMNDEVIPFRKIFQPCIPCIKPCDIYFCDHSCDLSKVSEYHVNINNLHLNTTMLVKEGEGFEEVPALYYLTIKAETGSGRAAIASSNGIVIDLTAPIFQYLYPLDLAWSPTQPIKFQSTNSSISAKWMAYDLESDILYYEWAIGTIPNATDIQNFKNVGLNEEATNNNLQGILEDRQTYYITVRTTNGAHLVAYQVTDVTVSISNPITSNITARIVNLPTSPCESKPSTVICYDRSSLAVEWDRVPDESINAYYFSVGTSKDTLFDVIPERQMGINQSEIVIIADGKITISGKFFTNISDLLINENSSIFDVGLNRFFMEPGRILFINIKACTESNKCGQISIEPVIYFKSDSQLADKKNAKIELKTSDVHIILDLLSENEDSILGAGFLTKSDLDQLYISDGSNSFESFISQPKETSSHTSRSLLGRIEEWLDVNFFVCMPYEKKFNATLNFMNVHPNNLIKLIYWDTEKRHWDQAEDSCLYKKNNNNFPNLTTFTICQKYSSVHYTFAYIDKKIVNYPPIIINPGIISLLQDSSKICYQVEAYDPDGDEIEFLPESKMNVLNIGSGFISHSGYLCYLPHPHQYGIDKFYFRVREKRNDLISSLSTNGNVSFEVVQQNQNPFLFIIKNGIRQQSSANGKIELKLQDEPSKKGFSALLIAYDFDKNDFINIFVSKPENGSFKIYQEYHNISFLPYDCHTKNVTDLSWFTDISKNNHSSLLLPYPCDWKLTFDVNQVIWTATVIQYLPKNKFSGPDTIKIVAQDKQFSLSDHQIIKLDIFYNPCQNNGKCLYMNCIGKTCTSSPECKCICERFFTGKYCEINMCPKKIGIYANPLDCGTFFQCSAYAAYIMKCPKNLVFNPKIKLCDWPANVPECKNYIG